MPAVAPDQQAGMVTGGSAPAATEKTRVLVFATKGEGSNEEARILALCERLPIERFSYDRKNKRGSMFRLIRKIREMRPELVVMEGTGLAGGFACMAGRLLFGARYVISSGDAVGPWVGSKYPVLAPVFGLYERVLCRLAAGFIGWTPYLVGRAMTLGTKRAVTAEGWAPYPVSTENDGHVRAEVRRELGIPQDKIVFGIVGSLGWNGRVGYCYGLELVKAISRAKRNDAVVLVVGGGDGLDKLKQLAGADLGKRIFLPGPVPWQQVSRYMEAIDVASLPQSVDGVGSFRYTTKVSEYLAAALPVVTGQIPLSYDLDDGWLWRLAGDLPWEDRYIDAMAQLMDSVTGQDIATKKLAARCDRSLFDRERQVRRVTEFLQDLLKR